eukprot:c15204_g1_i1.p1 GENE.c15204_g1_i1~~c15204_g1_i1.p1  ORF type:complete len:193 (+),score=41.75 c15204_g1_i1:240-818(+)
MWFVSDQAGIVTATLRTVDNDWWGLKGGSIVQFTWVALHAPDNWQNRLPEHVKQAMALTNTFEKFPWYDTITQFLLTTPQTNLLTSMTGHALLSNSDLIRSGLNIPFPSSTATSTPTSSVSSTLSPTASPSTSPSPSIPPRREGLTGGQTAGVVFAVLIGVGVSALALYQWRQGKCTTQMDVEGYALQQTRD